MDLPPGSRPSVIGALHPSRGPNGDSSEGSAPLHVVFGRNLTQQKLLQRRRLVGAFNLDHDGVVDPIISPVRRPVPKLGPDPCADRGFDRGLPEIEGDKEWVGEDVDARAGQIGRGLQSPNRMALGSEWRSQGAAAIGTVAAHNVANPPESDGLQVGRLKAWTSCTIHRTPRR